MPTTQLVMPRQPGTPHSLRGSDVAFAVPVGLEHRVWCAITPVDDGDLESHDQHFELRRLSAGTGSRSATAPQPNIKTLVHLTQGQVMGDLFQSLYFAGIWRAEVIMSEIWAELRQASLPQRSATKLGYGLKFFGFAKNLNSR